VTVTVFHLKLDLKTAKPFFNTKRKQGYQSKTHECE